MCGYRIPVNDDRLAAALAKLLREKHDVILLSCFMDMSDREIGELLDMARRTVQHQRTDVLFMLEILLLFWADTCVSMFPRFFSGLHLHKTYMRSSVIVELCQGWLISKAIDGIRKS